MLSSASAMQLTSEICSVAGLSSQGAELIRLGENALVRLPKAGVILRIARGTDVLADAKKEVAVAAWLKMSGIPAAQPTADLQPIVVHGHPVTFWVPLADSGQRAPLTELGKLLRAIHRLQVPQTLALPPLDIFGRVGIRVERASNLDPADRTFLTERLAELQLEYGSLQFGSTDGPLHGDAHIGNLIQKPSGEAVVIDFERFSFGPAETDLAVTATEFEIGWHSDADYAAFCEAYGADVRAWEGFPVLRDVQMLKMTTWLMQNIGDRPEIAVEFKVRMTSLRASSPGAWQPY